MNKFALDTMKIKSDWFREGKSNMYKNMGRDEGLDLYLQLFRFRIHQGDFNEHIFHTSLLELQRCTSINRRRRDKYLSIGKLKSMLLKLEDLGVIKIHTYNFENLIGNELLIIQATDTPDTERINDKDKIADDSFYIPVRFDLIDYMYSELKFTSREVSFFILLSMYGMRKGNSKTTMKINNMKIRLGTRNEKITEMLIKLNESGLIYTVIMSEGNKTRFEHYMCRSLDKLEEFKKESKKYRDKFLRRYAEDKDSK